MNPDPAFWRGRRVLLTGHTGFKGAWLGAWLASLGAEVTGLSLPPPPGPSLFVDAGLDRRLRSVIGDIRDTALLTEVFAQARPEVVLHLAAQALVRRSYAEPDLTFDTNVLGTVRVLEAARRCDALRAIVVVTSDKCYELRAGHPPYREDDELGGHDPYSASKACTELVATAWRRSYFEPTGSVGLATARAGNVIGGGDWAEDRLIPDCVRAMAAGRPIAIRHPAATRPWQHVLEPLSGYLLLAQCLWRDPAGYGESWNFGPLPDDVQPVHWLVERAVAAWGGGARWESATGSHPHEAAELVVDASKACERLGWRPRLDLARTLAMTLAWYRREHGGEPAAALLAEQIAEYQALAASAASPVRPAGATGATGATA